MRRKNLSLYFGIGVMAVVAIITSVFIFSRDLQDTKQEATNNKQKVITDRSVISHENENIAEERPVMIHQGKAKKTTPVTPKEEEKKETTETKKKEDTIATSVTPYNFHSSSTMEWPVRGNIIINYNMDNMVYFPTMDEYRYSDFVGIEAEEGENVKAGATGEVTKVENRHNTGLTVTMKVGPEYYIVYGQLKDCTLHEGDEVQRGHVFAKVAKVTASYEKEGNHLFLQILRKNDTENPLSFLEKTK